MKKIILGLGSLLLLNASLFAYDIKKDTFEVDGSFDLSLSKTDTEVTKDDYSSDKSIDITNISASVIRYSKENMGIGLNLSCISTAYESADISNTSIGL